MLRIKPDAPGAPMSLMPVLDELVITESPDWSEGEGGKLFITEGKLFAVVRMDGGEWSMSFALEQILTAIGAYTRQHES